MSDKPFITMAEPPVSGRWTQHIQNLKALLAVLFSIEPIIINIFALLLCAAVLFVLDQKDLLPKLGKYQSYFYHSIQLLAALQVVRSAKKSLILPIVTILLSIIGIFIVKDGAYVPIAIDTLRNLVILGIIGVGVSVFYMR